MIIPEKRYCFSRTGEAVVSGRSFRIPCVLYASSKGMSLPGFSPILVDSPSDTVGLQFVSGNNVLMGERRFEGRDNTIFLPAFMPYSSYMDNPASAHSMSDSGNIALCYSGAKGVADELRRYAAGSEMVMAVNASELYPDTGVFSSYLIELRRASGFSKAVYLPGIATPENLSLLIYAGADVLDSVYTDFLSASGVAFVDGMRSDPSVLREGVCTCESCVSGEFDITIHNRLQLKSELARCSVALEGGFMREYVEARASLSAWNNEMLRHFDSFYDAYESVAPDAAHLIKCNTSHSFNRAEIRRYAQRIRQRYLPPKAGIALLVPCSMVKPYQKSRSHALFARAVDASGRANSVHIITLTSPLGLVPSELETVFPAAHYDIPVTGVWSHEEKERTLELLRYILEKGGYSLIISHLEDERDFVNNALKEWDMDFVDTSGGRTRSENSLHQLTSAISSASLGGPDRKGWNAQLLRSIVSFQFGIQAGTVLEGCSYAGRFPYLRIMKEGNQLGMLTPVRGCVSLTIAGAEKIAPLSPGYVVKMGDFRLRGNLFASGVEDAGAEIREGDEVVIVDGSGVAAVGVASMSSSEMREKGRGMAVSVRHRRQ
ncbi:MAG: DUF5591 domain-containing protein [Methanomassiliicoccales archaeon]